MNKLENRVNKLESRTPRGAAARVMGVAFDAPGKGDLVWRGPAWDWRPGDGRAALAEAQAAGYGPVKILNGVDPDAL